MRALIVLLSAWSLAAAAADWTDVDLGRRIREGVATRDHIWLLGATGKVVRFDRRTGERRIVADNARDLLSSDGKIWALLQASDPASFTIRDIRDEGWAPLPGQARTLYSQYVFPGATGPGEVLGIVDWPGEDRPALVAARMVITPVEEGWRRWPLAASLDRWGWLATPDGRSVYVGYNHGEWGGGLRRVDLASGAISFVTEPDGRLCGGLINPACAPVVGAFVDRGAPDCLLAASGIAHLGISHGQVFRVCGDAISQVYSTPAPAEKDVWSMTPQPWPLDGFFETRDGWIGTSRERYFRSIGGEVREHPLPAFNDWSGIRISDEQDGVLFLVAACCWGSDQHRLYQALALPIQP